MAFEEARESQVLYRFFLRYLPDGKRLAIADLEGKVHIVDADTGKLLAKVEETALPAKKTQIAEVKPPEVKPPDAKSPDGKFPGMATNLHGLALSPDGKTMALGSSNGLLLIDTSTGKKIRQINPQYARKDIQYRVFRRLQKNGLGRRRLDCHFRPVDRSRTESI